MPGTDKPTLHARSPRCDSRAALSSLVAFLLLAAPCAAAGSVTGGDPPSQTPARLRAQILYSRGEFDTLPHRFLHASRADRETDGSAPPLERRIEDRWIARDKAQHLAFSFLWTLGTQYVAVNKGGLSEHRALPLSITSSAVVGLSKEYYDLKAGPTRYFSVRDLVADAVGIVLAVGLIVL